jgi:hypothetical protein
LVAHFIMGKFPVTTEDRKQQPRAQITEDALSKSGQMRIRYRSDIGLMAVMWLLVFCLFTLSIRVFSKSVHTYNKKRYLVGR